MNTKNIFFTFNQKPVHILHVHSALKMQKAKFNDACCTQNLKMDDLLVVVMMSLSPLL